LLIWAQILVSWDCKTPWLDSHLVPDSNTTEDRTPLWHNSQRQVGAGRPPTRHQVVSCVFHLLWVWWKGRTDVIEASGSIDLEGVHPWQHNCVGFGVSQLSF